MMSNTRKQLVSRIVIFLAFMECFQGIIPESEARENNYITWGDMSWSDHKSGSDSGDSDNQRRYIVVDKNGRGDSETVQGAIDMVPDNNSQRVKIFILPGTYREKVVVPASKPYVSLIGKASSTSDTVISWNDKASDKDSRGRELHTPRSASVTIEADYFCATGITFENTADVVPGDYGAQAVALRVHGDKAMFYRVRVLGSQDTLLDEIGSHYFYQCYIEGSVDFIFGNAKSLYEDCVLHSTAKNFGAVAAHGRNSPEEDTGYSFVHCKISGTGDIFLGRAWGDYARIVYSYCYMDDTITPAGWNDWNDPHKQRTAQFGEYQCSGRGADQRGRVPWSRSLSYEDVRPFLDTRFVDGDQWLKL